MSDSRINAYHIMWLFVFFDLPVTTKKERKEAAVFRKNLIKDGFTMMQFSVYIRHCSSYESQKVHCLRIQQIIPKYGNVSILSVTDKQFGDIKNYYGQKVDTKPQPTYLQLELF